MLLPRPRPERWPYDSAMACLYCDVWSRSIRVHTCCVCLRTACGLLMHYLLPDNLRPCVAALCRRSCVCCQRCPRATRGGASGRLASFSDLWLRPPLPRQANAEQLA